ncbi:MAG: deoxyhypusine synthase [Phycisphaerales bacterium JB043]
MSGALGLNKSDCLGQPVEHVDITSLDTRPLVDQMDRMAFSARDVARASQIFDRMIDDTDCMVILCLAGSLVSAGLKRVFVEMIRTNMVDAIVSTGANIVDQDFFESLGFRHYKAPDEFKSGVHDNTLRELGIDRIYDTLISEDDLRVCDDTITSIADGLEPRPYSSREFIRQMGRYLDENTPSSETGMVWEAYRRGVPIFCPAFSDCSAGFGLVAHQARRLDTTHLTIDSVRDFHELTRLKMACPESGLFMVGGGVPKNFAQDIVVAADILGEPVSMHKYAIQVTVADERDGALSGSTLSEACSWGKVDTTFEQMVYSEATLAVPLIAGYAYHQRSWEKRSARDLNALLDQAHAVT